jgi:5-methylcytosine-specific restriction enzyme B
LSRFNPHRPDAEQVFAAADKFKQRCLLDQNSLLLERQKLWTPEHFTPLVDNYVKQPDLGGGGFYEKLAVQLAGCKPMNVALMAEIFWIVQLGPTNLLGATKKKTIERIWNMNPAAPFPASSAFLESTVLSGLGSAGTGYNNYLWMEMAFAIDAFAAFSVKTHSDRVGLVSDGLAFASWLDSIPSSKGRQFYHTLCHVLFPDLFERIFSQGNKNQVARAHNVWTSKVGDNRPALDMALHELRKRLDVQYPGQVDYYVPPVGTLIKQQVTEKAKLPASSTGHDAPAKSAATNFVSETSNEYDVESIGNAKPTLRFADNLILFGPPGTGKTYAMQLRMRAAYDQGEDFTFVAFHPSYTYEDFVGGLRPVPVKDGAGIGVAFQKGPFITLCEKAHANPTLRFTLFIDEINRANVAKVFGELITLIEPSKRVIAGSKSNDSDYGAWVTIPGLHDQFGVPDNLNIVATMNTADRSIAMMDIALRRRFRFQECAPEPHRIEPSLVGNISLPDLLQKLNDRLELLLDRDHAIGHAFFMGIHSLDDLQQVLAQRVIPLLQEYFFEDLDKVRLVLTGNSKGGAFFKLRVLSQAELFPGAKQTIGMESRGSFSVTDPTKWTEQEIMSLYSEQATKELSEAVASSEISGASSADVTN